MMSRVPSRLYDLFGECTVRVVAGSGAAENWGTGFFVARGRVLTCAHVVLARDGSVRTLIRIEREDGATAAVTPAPEGVFGGDFPDLALLELDLDAHPAFRGHLVMPLDGDVQPGEDVYSYGYGTSKVRLPGGPLIGQVEGWANAGPNALRKGKLIQLKATQVLPGMSGAALLNLRTGKVCGVVKRTRDYATDLGGWAVPVTMVEDLFQPALDQSGTAGTEEWTTLLEQMDDGAPGEAFVPPLLSHQCDRDPLRETLGEELKSHAGACRNRPFVCFLHGPPDELPEAFVRHAHELIVGQALGFPEPGSFEPLEWPDPDAPGPRWERLKEKVTALVLHDPAAAPEALVSALGARRLTVFSTNLYSNAWTRDEPEIIANWLRFWASLPDLPEGAAVVVFAAIQYAPAGPGLFEGWQARRAAKRIAGYLGNELPRRMQAVTGASPRQLSLVVLPPLPPIPLSKAKIWAETHAAQYCARYLQLITQLNDMYKKRPTYTMQELAAVFDDFLSRCTRPQSAS